VVVFLIGIIVSMMTLSIGDGGKQQYFDDEARRFVTLLQMARDEATIKSQEWAVVIREDSYLFELSEMALDENGNPIISLTPIPDKIFRERKLNRLRFSMIVEGLQVNVREGDDDQGVIARLFIQSSGEMTESEMKLSQEENEQYYQINTYEFGGISMKNSNEL